MTVSRRTFLGGMTAAGLLSAAGCASGNSSTSSTSSTSSGGGGTRQLRLALEGPVGTSQELGASIFKESLEKASGGRLKLATYPGAQLGGEPELLQKIRTGDVDFIISSSANAAQLAPESGVFSLHYLMADKEQVQKVVADEAVNQAYRDMAAAKVKGAQALTLFTLPLRNFYDKDREIHSVADLKGRKVRVQATKTEDAVFAAYGAQTVHMSFTELYTALQTGVVDVAENAVDYYGLNKHYEVAPIMSMSEHEANFQVLWASDKVMESLSEEERGYVTTAASEVRTTQPAKAFALESGLQAKYEKLGVKFVKDVDKKSFQKISVPMQDSLATSLGPDAVKILKAVRSVTGGS